MNTKRLFVLGLALVAASGAALLLRTMLGGGTPRAEAKAAPVIAMSEVLVASANLTPGQMLNVDQLHWQKWPRASVDPSFITHADAGSIEAAAKGMVVRSPLLAGQPVTTTSIVHGEASGFMAATLTDGMRAISIAISADSSAGGFILPNDRVDVILTRKFDANPPKVVAKTILVNLRVLAVDQTFRQEKDTRTVIGKTATVEVTPQQAEVISAAASAGQLSLALRPLGDVALAEAPSRKRRASSDGPVAVIRYGLEAAGGLSQEPAR